MIMFSNLLIAKRVLINADWHLHAGAGEEFY